MNKYTYIPMILAIIVLTTLTNYLFDDPWWTLPLCFIGGAVIGYLVALAVNIENYFKRIKK